MTGEAHEVPSIISSKAGLKYAGLELDAVCVCIGVYVHHGIYLCRA